tara:strand:- start:646 stop:1296 length:651 start_codon:yes stop_codon:yes gene_type:complete
MNTTTNDKVRLALHWSAVLTRNAVNTKLLAQELIHCFQHCDKLLQKQRKPYDLKVKKAYQKHKESIAGLKKETGNLELSLEALREKLVEWYEKTKKKMEKDGKRSKPFNAEVTLLQEKWEAEVLALEEQGKVEEAELLRENLPKTVNEEIVTLDGARFDESWSCEVVDVNKLPAKYFKPDLKKIQKDIESLRGVTSIPGVSATRTYRSVLTRAKSL